MEGKYDRKKEELVVFVSDLHIPYHDKRTVKSVDEFLKKWQPDQLVLGGDIIDMYSISRFDKDPRRASRLQEEFDETNQYLKNIRKMLPKQKIVYLEGNHCERMDKYLMRHPELHGLRTLKVPYQLGLKELNIPYMKDYVYKNFLFTHGTKISKYTSMAELEKNVMSGVSGHKHTMQVAYKTIRGKDYKWITNGHLCDIKQAEYVQNPDWQQGITLVWFNKKNRRFFSEPLEVVDHKIFYRGKYYGN